MKWACGLIIGEADSPDSAEKLVRAFRNCPFSAFVRVLRLPKRRETLLRAGHVVIAVSSTKLARAARPQFSIKEHPREAKMFRAKRGRSPRPVEFRPGIRQGLEWA
jgi:hypothetical protein